MKIDVRSVRATVTQLTLNEMEQANDGPLPAIVVAAAKTVGSTALVAAVGTFVSNVVDDLMDDSSNSCNNDGS